MSLKILKTNFIAEGEFSYILATCETEDEFTWTGHYLILSKKIQLDKPITEYTLCSRKVRQKLDNFSKADDFLNRVVEHATNSFEVKLCEQDKDFYMNLMCSSKGLSFEEIDIPIAISKIFENYSDDDQGLIQRFAGLAYSDELDKSIRRAELFRRFLSVQEMD